MCYNMTIQYYYHSLHYYHFYMLSYTQRRCPIPRLLQMVCYKWSLKYKQVNKAMLTYMLRPTY